MAKITSQEALNARQDAEDAKYRKLTERALKIVAANRIYSRPYAYGLDWAREAAANAKDEWYVAALLRQADRLGVKIPDELLAVEPEVEALPAPVRRPARKPARRRQPACNVTVPEAVAA